MKADLHFHPGGFFGPRYSHAKIGTLVDAALRRDIEIVGLTSCHDLRYDNYRSQLENLLSDDEDSARKIFRINKDGKRVYFLDVQELKCADGDINVICPGKVLRYKPFTKDMDYIAREAKELGALVSLGQPVKSAESVRRLLQEGLVDFFDAWDALNTERNNRKNRDIFYNLSGQIPLDRRKAQGLAVSDGHRDSDLGISNSEIQMSFDGIKEFYDSLKMAEVTDWNIKLIGFGGKMNYLVNLAWAMARSKVKPYEHFI